MKIFTIGFTRTTAQNFFERLKGAGVRKIIDVRLNNISQLAGFAKKDDLKFFADKICGIGYRHALKLAPTRGMLDDYRKKKGPWDVYESRFLDLIAERKIEDIDENDIDGGCLLCSEDKPHHCHRRLVAEYLKKKWGDIDIIHL